MGKRAELRREKHKKETTYTLTASQIQAIKDEATAKAVRTAFILMLGLPTMVIHDYFGKLMRKEKREETFVDLILDQYDGFERGYFTLEDVQTVLYEEANVKDIKDTYKKRVRHG